MSLEILSQQGEGLLSIPSDKRDGKWACKLDNLRMEISFEIVSTFPGAKEVSKYALPLFNRFMIAIKDLKQKPQDSLAYHFPGFIRNLQEDIEELENYVAHFQRSDKVYS